MNKKILSSIVGLLLVAGLAIGAVSVVDKLSFSATGQSAAWTLPAKAGSFWDVDMLAYCTTGGNITVYNPIRVTTLVSNMSSATEIPIYASASNVVEGVTITTNSFLLIDNAGTYTLANISATGVFSGGVMNFTVGSMSASAGAKVYVCQEADIITIPVEAANENLLKGIVTGKQGMPVHFVGGSAVGPASVYCGVANATKP